MTNNDNVNVYISSKNRLDGRASNFLVNIPNGLLTCKKNENWVMNVNGFYLINSWYNIQENYNNSFNIIVDGISTNILLKSGSPNINELFLDLQTKTSSYMTITYDRTTNKFTYTNISGGVLQIIPINSGGFLGLENLTVNEISVDGTECDNPIVVQGDMMLFLKLYGGDISLKNSTLDNIVDCDYSNDQIIFSTAINVPTGALISYNNQDGGDSFSHQITQFQEDIDHFSLIIVNENGIEITGMTDYIVLLQFKKVENLYNKIYYYLDSIQNILNNLYQFTKWFSTTYYNMIAPVEKNIIYK